VFATSTSSSVASAGKEDADATHQALPPPLRFEDDVVPFNGMCPGIEQTIQRTKKDLERGRGVIEGLLEKKKDGGGGLKFMFWNIHDGAGEKGRYKAMLRALRKNGADVVGIVEAVGWEEAMPEGWNAEGVSGRRRAPAASGKYKKTSVLFPGEAEEEEEEEEVYLMGPNRLPHTRSFNTTTSDLERRLNPQLRQTAAFRRRAATAGYPYAHLLQSPSGYHVALLSTAPLSIVLEDAAGENFQRGLLVGDAGGVRWVVSHLHAGSSETRLTEAGRVWSLMASYTAAGIPSVLMGDFNSLSPRDATCHSSEGVLASFLRPSAPAHLLTKYACRETAPGCKEQALRAAAQGAALPGDSAPPSLTPLSGWFLDYRPLQLLLTSVQEGGPLLDLLPAPDQLRSCPASYPSSYIAEKAGVEGVDANDDNAHTPTRLDFALGNAPFVQLHAGLQCRVGGLDFTPEGFAVDPPSGRLLSGELAKGAFADYVKGSDHLPLLCQRYPGKSAAGVNK